MRSLAVFAALLACASPVSAGCQTELRVLADDLNGVVLTMEQNQDFAGIVLLARRYCWVHREREAMDLIAKARKVAGLKPSSGEFDWENVPLESLEPKD